MRVRAGAWGQGGGEMSIGPGSYRVRGVWVRGRGQGGGVRYRVLGAC